MYTDLVVDLHTHKEVNYILKVKGKVNTRSVEHFHRELHTLLHIAAISMSIYPQFSLTHKTNIAY